MAGSFSVNCLCSMISTGMFIAGCTIFLVTAFPIAQIALGVVYLYECPAAPMIPVYVMVCGILALLLMGLFALSNMVCPAAPRNKIWTLWNLSMVVFTFIWFLYGSYQIYSVYQPNYIKINTDPNSGNKSTYDPTLPDNKANITSENQTLSNINQSWTMSNNQESQNQSLNHNQTNQTLLSLIQSLALSNISSVANRQHLNAHSPSHHIRTAVPYCHRTLYMFAFWTTTLVYVLAGNALVLFICVYGFIKCMHLITA